MSWMEESHSLLTMDRARTRHFFMTQRPFAPSSWRGIPRSYIFPCLLWRKAFDLTTSDTALHRSYRRLYSCTDTERDSFFFFFFFAIPKLWSCSFHVCKRDLAYQMPFFLLGIAVSLHCFLNLPYSRDL